MDRPVGEAFMQRFAKGVSCTCAGRRSAWDSSRRLPGRPPAGGARTIVSAIARVAIVLGLTACSIASTRHAGIAPSATAEIRPIDAPTEPAEPGGSFIAQAQRSIEWREY